MVYIYDSHYSNSILKLIFPTSFDVFNTSEENCNIKSRTILLYESERLVNSTNVALTKYMCILRFFIFQVRSHTCSLNKFDFQATCVD